MQEKRCLACKQTFVARAQTPHQAYCSTENCQRERRRQWQRLKLHADHDYKDNQARAQKAWSRRRPDYWREYRESHQDYVERNREKQSQRNAKASGASLAKMDASNSAVPLSSGTYRLIPLNDLNVAKMDAWIVEITVLSGPPKKTPPIAKR